MNHIANFPEKISRIKENNEDFEWYPTTNKMIEMVFDDVRKCDPRNNKKLLDIGSGDGNLFSVWDKLIDKKFPRDEYGYRPNLMNVPQTYFAIEKSPILLEYLPKEVITIGTDFHNQTLIDKQMDVIFSNPPYSDFVAWAEKIILEANCSLLYLVLPERWKNSDVNNNVLKKALERRNAEYEVIHSDNFENAARAARVNIDIIRIDYRRKRTDPFDLWFKDSFGSFDLFDDPKIKEETATLDEKCEMVSGSNIIERLESLYNEEMSHIKETYEKILSLDANILKEFNIDIKKIKTGLEEKLSGLKHLYWNELFSKLKKLTDRLTLRSRENLLGKLQSNTEVDFSANNAYAIIIWAIKNSNEYFDKQLVECYEKLVNRESCLAYKSNSHFSKDDWRFAQESSRYYLNDKLDYRIVTHRVGGFYNGRWSFQSHYGLSKTAYNYIQDICTVAKNLGYDVESNSLDVEWIPGKERIFYSKLPGEYEIGDKTPYGKVTDKTNEQYCIKGVWYSKKGMYKVEQFMSVRAFKNGNIHFKFNQTFLRKFNVEFGRLKGWINSAQEASEEFNIPMNQIGYATNYMVQANSQFLLENVV